MSNLIKNIKKFFNCIFFYISLSIGTILSLLSAFLNLKLYFSSVPDSEDLSNNNLIPIFTTYSFWLGSGKQNIFSLILFWVLPILASIPVLNRCRKNFYISSKKSIFANLEECFASFIVSGVTIAIPFLINFLCIALFVPLINPDSVYEIYYGVLSYHPFSDVFYSHPFLHVLLYIAIFFLIGGLIGSVVDTLLIIYDNNIYIFFVPPILIIFLQLDYLYFDIVNINISLISFFYSYADMFENFKVVLIEASFMFFFSIVNIFKNTNKKSEEK